MPDREKVIKGLVSCNSALCQKCPYNENKECNNRGFFYSQAIEDAISLLKKHETVPVDNGKCPSCNWDFEDGELDFFNINESRFYCPRCGQAVKFEVLH